MNKYIKSAYMSSLEKTNGGLVFLVPGFFIKACTLIALIYLWRAAISFGAKVDMTAAQMVSYTYISALLSSMMVVETPASGWMSEGVILRLYTRPSSIIGELAAVTVGGWLPQLIYFSLPMAAAAHVFGAVIMPVSMWFFLSLLLCVTLGFAIDLLFACLSLKLRNMRWLVNRIRMAVVTLLSGTVIPIKLLPVNIGDILRFQPFACLGGSPLSLFVGAAQPIDILPLQIIWNLALWPIAILLFNKAQEGMVSYGG